MKIKVWIILQLLLIVPLSAFQNNQDPKNGAAAEQELELPLQAAFFYLNDNYIATWWPDYNDQYFGADDFLTVSFLSRLYWNDWKLSVNYSAVTLRKFNLRYDLLSSTLTKKISYSNYNIYGGVGIIYKGNLGGQDIQNGVHKLGNVKLVEMPYSTQSGLAYIIQFMAETISTAHLIEKDRFLPFIEIRILNKYIPSRYTAGIRYQWLFYKLFQIELLTAYRGYLNSEKEFSSMVRPGFMHAIDLKINFYRNYFIDVGFSVVPTKNILSDTIYSPYKNDFLPQAWISFSWDTQWLSLLEHLDY